MTKGKYLRQGQGERCGSLGLLKSVSWRESGPRLSLDVHEETLALACGTPLSNFHVSLGQRSDVLHLVIIPLRLSRPVVSSHVYVASKILPR